MILSDKEKQNVKIEGTWYQILGELSVLIEELSKDIEKDRIMFAVKLGFTGGNTSKMLDLAKDEIMRRKEKRKND